MTDREKEIIKEITDPLYTVEFLEKWIVRSDNVEVNAPAALQAVEAKGFYRAIKCLAGKEAAGEKSCCMAAIKRILQEIEQKQDIGYAAEQLEVDYGYIEDEENEGYYLSKLNGWGATPITEILAKEGELDETELIKELDKRKIAHCLR